MTMLCRPEESTLILVDLQARLMPAIHDGETVVRRCVQLATAAHELGIHVIGTEENPDGLGPLVGEIAALCDTTLSKFHFSAPAEEGFLRRLPAGRDTLVVAGCEAHVCVLQTVIGLLESGHAVKWVADAVGSRHPHDRLAATERARKLGADIVTTEMVIFEWLGTSQHPKFKRLSQLIR
jgi:Amidases related to nicotinamidase